MRIYKNPIEAVSESGRDLWELGINVAIETMQDKDVKNDDGYLTKEVRGYGFQISDWQWNAWEEDCALGKVFHGQNERDRIQTYVAQEFSDRVSGKALNPGNSWKIRPEVWEEFLHDGKFSYTYSERLAPQWFHFFKELKERPGTRQAVLNIHTNICPVLDHRSKDGKRMLSSQDDYNMGGIGRIPCSLYYQAMIREGALDWIYGMRSCDYLTHFPIDICIALRIQSWVAGKLDLRQGLFTYFTGSLHAYYKDLKERGIF